MTLILNNRVDGFKYYEGWIVNNRLDPAPEVISALCQAFVLLPKFLDEKTASRIETVKVGFEQGQTDLYIEPYLTAVLLIKQIHDDLPDDWTVEIKFYPRSLAPNGPGDPVTEERPLTFVNQHDRPYGRVYPPELVAERFAQAIDGSLRRRIAEVCKALRTKVVNPIEE